MAKKQTKADKLRDQYDTYRCIRDGKKPKRSCRKDGSIVVKPLPGTPPWTEAEVLKSCVAYLEKFNIVVDRNNVGSGAVGVSGFYSYGIKSGGDIFVILPGGLHLEIECKSGKGGLLSKGQQERKRKVEAVGSMYVVVCGLEEMIRKLTGII